MQSRRLVNKNCSRLKKGENGRVEKGKSVGIEAGAWWIVRRLKKTAGRRNPRGGLDGSHPLTAQTGTR
jgi:hypothetical protein